MTVKRTTPLEWVAIIVVSLLIAAGAIALLSGYFAGQDTPGVTGSSSGPGIALRDMGNAHLRPGQPVPRYNSNPPTSGPHVPVPVRRNATTLSNNQLLTALELGDVVLMYGTRSGPPGLGRLARSVAGRFTPALASTGQAVILARRPGVAGVIGLAWAHIIQVHGPSAPSLRQFAQYWLGRGASGR
jgi:hypothetical protein